MQHQRSSQMQRKGAQPVRYQPNTFFRSHEKHRGLSINVFQLPEIFPILDFALSEGRAREHVLWRS